MCERLMVTLLVVSFGGSVGGGARVAEAVPKPAPKPAKTTKPLTLVQAQKKIPKGQLVRFAELVKLPGKAEAPPIEVPLVVSAKRGCPFAEDFPAAGPDEADFTARLFLPDSDKPLVLPFSTGGDDDLRSRLEATSCCQKWKRVPSPPDVIVFQSSCGAFMCSESCRAAQRFIVILPERPTESMAYALTCATDPESFVGAAGRVHATCDRFEVNEATLRFDFEEALIAPCADAAAQKAGRIESGKRRTRSIELSTAPGETGSRRLIEKASEWQPVEKGSWGCEAGK